MRCSITEVGARWLRAASYCDLAWGAAQALSGRWGLGWASPDPSGQAEGGCSRDGGPRAPVDHCVPPWTCPSSGSHNPLLPSLLGSGGHLPRRVSAICELEGSQQTPGQAARRRLQLGPQADSRRRA